MAVKRDRVNRYTGLVHLPMDGSRLMPGQVIPLKDISESNIETFSLDAMIMSDPVSGDSIGDAVFDAMLPNAGTFDAMDG